MVNTLNDSYSKIVSTEPAAPSWNADADLTAKARIRNAALELHAANGEANTSVREVAKAAGVTHGLVVHHFGNKDGLRRAVQQQVVDLVRQAITAVPAHGTPQEVGQARDANVARIWREHPVFPRYVRRVLLDPSEDGDELLDLLTDLTLTAVHELRLAGITTSDAPEHTQAMAILMRELVPRLVQPVVEHAWTHLTGGTGGPPPNLEVKLNPTDDVND